MEARPVTAVAMTAFLCWASLAGVSAASPEAAFVKKTISSHNIVIFSKSYCPYCRRAKSVLKELNRVPHVVELDQRSFVHKFSNVITNYKKRIDLIVSKYICMNVLGVIEKTDLLLTSDGSNIQDALSEIVGRRTVPQVFINVTHIGGSDDTVEAYESGKLAKLGVAVDDEDL